MAAIALEQVTKVYANGYEAVRRLDLAIRDGELLVLVGPSGCGKTTVLRMVAGLESITAGIVRIGDRVVNNLDPKERDVAMVFQNYALYPHMTVAENIGFALKLRGDKRGEINAAVDAAAHMLGLTGLLNNKPGQLSGGQRQRVAMGRAIVRQPQVFLMDEPLSNLDAQLRAQMREEVAAVQRRLGVATLYVTHDQTEAMTMGDRVAVLHDGVLQQCDSPQTLYDRPANRFVAGFLGSPAMNLYDGALGTDGRTVHLAGQVITIPDSVLASKPAVSRFADRPIGLGIRPEDLSAEHDGRVASLTGEVTLLEVLGSEVLVHFSVAESAAESMTNLSSVERLTANGFKGIARVEPKTRIKVGDRVRFGLDPSQLHFFNHETGEAL